MWQTIIISIYFNTSILTVYFKYFKLTFINFILVLSAIGLLLLSYLHALIVPKVILIFLFVASSIGDYYFMKFGLDVRGIRYPGIISSETLPGGGTTDYAVEIFYEAIKNKKYTCFLKKDTVLPMMYMPDCIKATIDLMEADVSKLKHHCDFNLASMSFSAEELASEIKKYIPEFKCDYKPDFRQAIADSWPQSIDDSASRKEWGWKTAYNISSMTKDMIDKLSKRYKQGKL